MGWAALWVDWLLDCLQRLLRRCEFQQGLVARTVVVPMATGLRGRLRQRKPMWWLAVAAQGP